MKWWESHHLEHTQLSYFRHLILGIYLSFLALSVFVLGIIHSFIPNFIPFLPIEIIDKIKEIFEHNYSTKPKNE
jgi:hypothetical protein